MRKERTVHSALPLPKAYIFSAESLRIGQQINTDIFIVCPRYFSKPDEGNHNTCNQLGIKLALPKTSLYFFGRVNFHPLHDKSLLSIMPFQSVPIACKCNRKKILEIIPYFKILIHRIQLNYLNL